MRQKRYIAVMSVLNPSDWATTRKSCVRLCVGVLCVIAAMQVTLSLGVPLGVLMWGGGEAKLPLSLCAASMLYALVCLGLVRVLLGRAELIGHGSRLLWKVLAWAAPALSGFAMTGHLLSSSPAEQALMGGATAFDAIMSLFVAFSPDDADMIGNAQMTEPAKP